MPPKSPQSAKIKELQKQLELRDMQLHAFQRIGLAMASTMKPSQIIRNILSEVMRITSADSATVYLRDKQSHQLIPEFSQGKDTAKVHPMDLLASDDLAVEVAHTAKLRQTYGVQKTAQRKRTRICETSFCRLSIPLVAEDEVLGVIDLKSHRPEPFDKDTEEFLATLASQAAQVFRNASIYEDLEQHYRELSLLYEIQQEISSTVDYKNILTLIVERTRRLLDARECSIRLVLERGGKRYMRLVASTGAVVGPEEMPYDDSILDQQVISGELLFIEDVRKDKRFRYRADARKAGLVSMLGAPLVARRNTIGAIRLFTSERRDFTVADRKMLMAVAGQAAAAIENARLYNQIESKNRELSASYEALRRTQKELVKKERLAALGEMAATVAHEIRNPLTSIRGFAQRIARQYDKVVDSRLASYTEIIMEEVDRLNKFIKDVLDFARHVKPNFEKTNINELVGEILNFMRDELTHRNVVVLTDLDMTLRETVVDSGQIKQALLNILQNARQAVGPNGVITVRTNNAGSSVRIRVSDNGSGIARDDMNRIWSPFFTTKTQGTGLGLSLVQRIIDDHHGRIYIRSRVGKGTIVDIFLPVVETAEELLNFD
ncbi:MAG: GAF domain-containing protein [Candidatus Sumerlaeaceae bacterium]|nr:GAF domain-containing protein [Candidatus Sumerlaeaceae bacterium]